MLAFNFFVVAIFVALSSANPDKALDFTQSLARASNQPDAFWVPTTIPEESEETIHLSTQLSSDLPEATTLNISQDDPLNIQIRAYLTSLSQSELEELQEEFLRMNPTTQRMNPTSRKGCSILPWEIEVWECLSSLFFSKSSNSLSEWFMDAIGGSAQMKTMFMEVIKTCGKNAAKDVLPSAIWKLAETMFTPPGPYDALICDLLDAVRTGSPSDIGLLGVQECVDKEGEPLAQECLKEFVGGGSKLEMVKTVFAAVTGWGWNDIESPENMVEEIANGYRTCKGVQSNSMFKCMALSFVDSTCNGICKAATCQITAYENSNSTACHNGMKTGCTALFATADLLCKKTTEKISDDAEFPQHTCLGRCGAAFSSNIQMSLIAVLSMAFFVQF